MTPRPANRVDYDSSYSEFLIHRVCETFLSASTVLIGSFTELGTNKSAQASLLSSLMEQEWVRGWRKATWADFSVVNKQKQSPWNSISPPSALWWVPSTEAVWCKRLDRPLIQYSPLYPSCKDANARRCSTTQEPHTTQRPKSFRGLYSGGLKYVSASQGQQRERKHEVISSVKKGGQEPATLPHRCNCLIRLLRLTG